MYNFGFFYIDGYWFSVSYYHNLHTTIYLCQSITHTHTRAHTHTHTHTYIYIYIYISSRRADFHDSPHLSHPLSLLLCPLYSIQ